MKITDSKHRLEELMNAFSLRPADIVKSTGISKACISRYLTGEREPKQDKVGIISEAYNIDPTWLMGYDVPMRRQLADADKLADITLNPELVDYAWKILQMDDTQRNIIYGMIDQMSK